MSNFIDILITIITITSLFTFLKVNFFTVFLCVHTSRGTLMEIRTVLDLF